MRLNITRLKIMQISSDLGVADFLKDFFLILQFVGDDTSLKFVVMTAFFSCHSRASVYNFFATGSKAEFRNCF